MHRSRQFVLVLLCSLIMLGCGSRQTEDDVNLDILRVAAFPIVQTDPAYISSDSEVMVANLVYDYLVDIDANNEIHPRLAVDWSRSVDGLRYTFQLAEGVTFHDGTPLTGEDVVWTFERLRDTEGLPTTDLYHDIINIEAGGKQQVTFTIRQHNPFFLYDLSDNHALILKAGTENPGDFNGTGPFILDTYLPEESVSLQANENYYIQGQPLLDEIEIIFFNDQTASSAALRSGQVDLTMDLSTDLYESLQGQDGISTTDIPTNQFAVIRLRTDQPPGDDPRVIQALKLATDRKAIFNQLQRGYGAIGQDTPIGPLFTAFYTEKYHLPDYDPEAARQLLAEAGYPDGLDLELKLLETLNFPELAEIIKEQWSHAGVRLSITTLPESVYYGEGEWLDANLGITGWGHRPYPQFYFEVMLVCGAKWNESRYCNPEFDDLVATAGSTLDEVRRVYAYQETQRILTEGGPIIVPYFFAEYAAINSRFEGFKLNPFSGRTDLRIVQVGGE